MIIAGCRLQFHHPIIPSFHHSNIPSFQQKHKAMITRFCIIGLLFTAIFATAQEAPAPLTSEEKKEVIDSVSAIVERLYVFPEVGEAIAKHLRKKQKKGEYASLSDPFEFAQMLTEDVRSVNNDLHLRVRFDPQTIADWRSAETPEDSLTLVQRWRRMGQLSNYGFEEVKILEGNIGYLKLNEFYNVDEESGATAVAAMNFLSNADALIIDLRTNGGGSPAMIQLISSYLFDPQPVHLNTFYYRPQDEYTQTWTLPHVEGKRRPDIEVYVLTSKRTFSAAEEFSYNLRNLERATLVGEVTGGGAHPGGTQIAADRFTVWVATGRAINPITQTNWEGSGVKPHIEVSAEEALLTARIHATEKLITKSEGQEKFQYEWALAGLKAEQNPAAPDQNLLQSYAGTYGPRVLTYEDGHLYYQREGREKYQLIPMSDDLFMMKEVPYFRLEVKVKDAKAVGLTGLYNNGRTDHNKRDEGQKADAGK
jgi:hypothetical protein